MRSRHCLAGFALASALVFGCAPSVEIDAPDIEVTQPNVAFPELPEGVPTGTPIPPFTFAISTAKLGAANNPDAGTLKKIQRLQITRMVFKVDPPIRKADPPIQDLSFLKQMTVKASSTWPGTQLTSDPHAITIVDYQATSNQPIGTVLQLPVSPPANLLPLWGHTWLYLTITVAGDLPRFPWSMDVVFSLSLNLVE